MTNEEVDKIRKLSDAIQCFEKLIDENRRKTVELQEVNHAHEAVVLLLEDKIEQLEKKRAINNKASVRHDSVGEES